MAGACGLEDLVPEVRLLLDIGGQHVCFSRAGSAGSSVSSAAVLRAGLAIIT